MGGLVRAGRQAMVLAGTVALAGAGVVVVVSAPAAATTFSVTTSNNSGAGSLRQAFIDASADVTGAHTIDVQAGLGPITLMAPGELLYNNASNEPLTIHGNGVTVNQTTAGNRVVNALSTGSLTIDRLTITGGSAAGGGGVAAEGVLTVTNSTISGNTAATGGGVDGVGAVTVTNSTISGNIATTGGGGIAADGAVTLMYATVVGNTAPDGSNVRLGGTGTANLTSFGSVVALPVGGGANCDLNATTTTSNGFNFSDDASCGFSAGTDHQNAGDPKLGTLANNGGPTLTRLPLAGSPLIDAIPAAHCSDDGASTISPLVDQIRLPRPQGAGCEIGAKEVPVAAPAPVVITPVVITPKFTG